MDDLRGLITAVEELREFRELAEKDSHYLSYIRFAEISVIQMAELLVDRHERTK